MHITDNIEPNVASRELHFQFKAVFEAFLDPNDILDLFEYAAVPFIRTRKVNCFHTVALQIRVHILCLNAAVWHAIDQEG